MTKKTKIQLLSIAAAVLFLVGVISGCLIHRGYVRAHQPPVQRDTVTIWKTVGTVDPAPQESHKGQTPISIPASEVTPTKDSSAYLVHPDVVTWRDTLSGGVSYQIQITGVQPTLSSMDIRYPEHTVTNTVYKPYEGWLFSITGTGGLTSYQPLAVSAIVGPELSYNKGIFHFGIQGGALIEYTPGANATFTPYVGGRLTIDIARMK